jgi:hypothetical protein
VLTELERSGQLDDTLLIFLSDNGASDETLPLVELERFKQRRDILRVQTRDGREVQVGNDPAVMPGGEDTYASYGRAWANLSNTPFRFYKRWTHEGGIATPLMMSFFKDIPPEIEQAALVDGCHPLSAFWHVVLPLAVPGLIAAGVLSFVFSWNEFSIALNLVSQTNATVPVVVAKFAQDYEIQHGQMAAASILATIPALVLMVFGQRFIVQGLTMGSVT